MQFNVPINSTDVVVLLVLAVLFALGVRALISFFRDPKPKKSKDETTSER